jgi:hypothetical protein
MILAEAGYDAEKHDAKIAAVRRRNLPNIGKIIEAVADAYASLYDCEINNGLCEDFAADVCSLVPGAEAWWDDELGKRPPETGSHKIIVFQGRYYDSECPEGTDDWKTLIR